MLIEQRVGLINDLRQFGVKVTDGSVFGPCLDSS